MQAGIPHQFIRGKYMMENVTRFIPFKPPDDHFDNVTAKPDLAMYPHSAVIATIYITTSVIGILGNSLVIIGVFFSPKLRTPTNVMIVNLAVSDLLTCLALPFQTAGVLSPPNQYPLPDFVCTIVGGITYLSYCCSAINLLLIAIIRTYVITRSTRVTALNSHKKQLSFAIFAWILACIYMFVPVYSFNLTEFTYYPPYRQCYTRPTSRSDYLHYYLAGLTGVHLVIILGCYLRIWLFVRRQRNHLQSYIGNGNGSVDQTLKKHLSRREINLTVNLFTVVLVFTLCTIPQAVVFFIKGFVLAGLYTTAILYVNNCINPVLYAFKHPVYTKLFKKLVDQVFSIRDERMLESSTDANDTSQRRASNNRCNTDEAFRSASAEFAEENVTSRSRESSCESQKIELDLRKMENGEHCNQCYDNRSTYITEEQWV